MVSPNIGIQWWWIKALPGEVESQGLASFQQELAPFQGVGSSKPNYPPLLGQGLTGNIWGRPINTKTGA